MIGGCGRLGYIAAIEWVRREVLMVVDPRRSRILREMEQEFVPDYDAASMPSADKRAAYALEHIAFRVSRIESLLARLVTAIESAIPKA
jgi:hypothetical protein